MQITVRRVELRAVMAPRRRGAEALSRAAPGEHPVGLGLPSVGVVVACEAASPRGVAQGTEQRIASLDRSASSRPNRPPATVRACDRAPVRRLTDLLAGAALAAVVAGCAVGNAPGQVVSRPFTATPPVATNAADPLPTSACQVAATVALDDHDLLQTITDTPTTYELNEKQVLTMVTQGRTILASAPQLPLPADDLGSSLAAAGQGILTTPAAQFILNDLAWMRQHCIRWVTKADV